MSGIKFDHGKDAFALLPWDAVRELARVFTRGAQKYEPRNWEQGLAYSRVMSSTMRHLTDWYQHRMELDPDGTGLRNIAQATWGCIVLLAFELRGLNGSPLDDRPVTQTSTKKGTPTEIDVPVPNEIDVPVVMKPRSEWPPPVELGPPVVRRRNGAKL